MSSRNAFGMNLKQKGGLFPSFSRRHFNQWSANFGILRHGRTNSLPSFSRTKYWQLWKNGGSLTFVWVKESFGCYSGHGDLPLKGSKQNIGRKMATRNLTEIYINLRTEISRFKAYSLGDSVRSDSPGVLYWHILPPKHTLFVLCCTRWRTSLMMICFDLI